MAHLPQLNLSSSLLGAHALKAILQGLLHLCLARELVLELCDALLSLEQALPGVGDDLFSVSEPTLGLVGPTPGGSKVLATLIQLCL